MNATQVYRDSRPVRQLKESPRFHRIKELVERKSGKDFGAVELSLYMALHRALEGPPAHERLTKAERVRIADRIIAAATKLTAELDALSLFENDSASWPFEFQSELDWLALSSTLDYQESLVDHGSPLGDFLSDDEAEGFHVARYSVYHLLTYGMKDVMSTLANAAERWRDTGTQALAKPNHKNARRLIFLRFLTRSFVRIFGGPARELTLELASVYFDCSDLTEADLSNLAPVARRGKSKGSLSFTK